MISDKKTVFQCTGLTYFYPNSDNPALENINLHIDEGQLVIVRGPSGSGKSTLGRVMSGIIPEFYGGRLIGDVFIGNQTAGMVFQDAEKQIVMHNVEREIAFGLENIGMHYDAMAKTVSETIELFELSNLKRRKTYEISAGEKQKVVISSIVAMGYKFLVLDEITSQLDACAAKQVLEIVTTLNKQRGYTIVLIENSEDGLIELADRVLFMDEGRILFDGTPRQFASAGDRVAQVFSSTTDGAYIRGGQTGKVYDYCCIEDTLKENVNVNCDMAGNIGENQHDNDKEEVIKMNGVDYTYGNGVQALKGVNASIFKGEIIGIFGNNGCGKSTLLKIIAGILHGQSGSTSIKGKVGYLSQQPDDYLFNETLYEELKYSIDNNNKKCDYSIIDKVLTQLEIINYSNRNPRDLSSGERQRAAIASVLVMIPDILVLDEPNRGLHKHLKNKLNQIIYYQKSAGTTVIIATHDLQMASAVCDRIFIMDDGNITDIIKPNRKKVPDI